MGAEHFKPNFRRPINNGFTYNPNEFPMWETLPHARLLRVDPSGDNVTPDAPIPKHRGLVVGVGTRQQLLITFPFGNTTLQGFHMLAEALAVRNLGRLNTEAIMNGSITQVITNGEKKRTVFIYEAPEPDSSIIKRDGAHFEQGKTNPLKFLTGPDFIPQRIMQALSADQLQVVRGTGSAAIFKI